MSRISMSLDIENGYKLGYILYINHAFPPVFVCWLHLLAE
jgi:hypothetical protein